MAPGIDPAGRTFRRSLSARVVSVTALVLFGLAVATRTVSGDLGAGYFILVALVLVSIAGMVSAWGDRITIDAAGVETRNVLLARLPGFGRRSRRRLGWNDILRVQEHRRPGSDPKDPPRALFLVPVRGRRLALDSIESFDQVLALVRRAMSDRSSAT
ncbi:MAG TPA: hypothetical protein VFD06_00895 [Candidatus Polarisedimenticolia bacterium]|nr:hypothetical protein [Candidatus Polarisedimenticolia bacterium]